ncbi:PAS domain S-box protein [Propionivibrio sp.]|uniref:PAS domain S-box protein n=1 Tax=Propionivibrio sp. TaxID=2212460 RepID=UPI003BF3F27D
MTIFGHPATPLPETGLPTMSSRHLRGLVILILVISNVAVFGLSWYFLLHSRQQYELRARTLSQNIASAVEQNLSSRIEKVDLALRSVADELERLLASKGIDEQAMTAYLSTQEQRLPEVDTFRVANAEGLIILGKEVNKNDRLSWADREYFIYLRDHADGALQISGPRMGRITKQHIVGFARRYNHADGRFAGIISASITVDYFTRLLSGFDLDQGGAIALRDAGLGLIARSPPITDLPGGQVGDSFVSTKLQQLAASGVDSATYFSLVNSDGVLRTITFNRLGNAPMIVLVGLASDDYLSNWRAEAYQTAAMDFGYLFLSLLVGGFLLRLLAHGETREQMLRLSEDRFNNAQQVAHIGSWHFDLIRNKLEWSDETYRIFGLTKNAALSYDGFLSIVHPEDRVAVNAAWQAALMGSGYDITHRIAVGEQVKWVRQQAVLDFDAQGHPESGVGTVQDITRQVLAQQALSTSEALFQATFEQAAMGIGMVASDGRWLKVNRRLCAMVGYTQAELMALTFQGITFADDLEASVETVRRLQAGEIQSYSTEKRYVRKDGSLVWIRATAALVRISDALPGILIAVVEDIDLRKQAKAELEQHRHHLEELVQARTVELSAARQQAETANHSKSRFLAAASHDLRQPLAALSLYVGVLKSKISPDSVELVGRIQLCADSLSSLLTDLLDVSKLDAGVVIPTPSDFAIDDLLDILFSVYSGPAREKGLRLRFRFSGAFARTDLKLAIRVIGNLVDNAIHYTRQGGVLVACRRHQGKQWVEVWDTGIGIAKDQTELVFEEFRQLGDAARNRGSGLGLAIVAKTAKLLGLQIRLRSRPGRGSMFAIELPPGRAVAPTQILPRRTAPRVLRIGVVEDNAEVLQALVLALENAGHDVVAATTGAEFVGRLGGRRPDIVISDYRLADSETGFDVIEAARKIFGDDLPALLLTGDTDPALIRSMADRGIAVHYKPLQIEALQAFINEVAERRGP